MESKGTPELLKTLEESLVTLFNKVPKDPWSLLMFQTIIWSFRRWAVHYLMTNEMTNSMKDYLWESHIELVREFAPKELKDFGVIWLNPTNVEDRVDVLEDLNKYFLFLVDKMDTALNDDIVDDQDVLSTFLDDRLTVIIDNWLEGRKEYRIYPTSEESPDDFPAHRIFHIMQLIMDTHLRPASNTVGIVDTVANVEEEEEEEQCDSVPEPVPDSVPEPEPEAAPEPVTVAAAIKRRRTMRLHRKQEGKKTRKNR